MSYAVPFVLITVGLPLLGAAVVATGAASTRGTTHARLVGGVVSGLVALLLALLLVDLVVSGGGRVEDPALELGVLGLRPLFGLDALSAVLALTNALTAFAVIVGAPRARDERARIVALLLTEGLILIMLASLDVVVLAIAFACLLIPAGVRARARREQPDPTKLYRLVLLGGAVPLAAALALMIFGGDQPLGPALFDLRTIAATPHPNGAVVLGLLLLAAALRMALLPLHSWLPGMTQYGALGSTVLLVASQSGAYLFVRLALAWFPDSVGNLVGWLTIVGSISAAYAALLALACDDLRRLIGWLSVSQAGLMLIGLCSLEPDGEAGTIVYWLSYGTAVTGLALTVWAVQARTGTTRISELGGLVRSCPRLTVGFAAFSIASVGFPGSLGFVAEDLLVHSVLEVHPLIGLIMIVATALNGIALIRALFLVFFGPERISAPADLRARELCVIAGLAIVVFGLGLWPDPLVEIVDLALPSIHL